MASASGLSPEAFQYAFSHIFLHPQLPQKEDFDPSHENELLCFVLNAMEKFQVFRHSTVDFQHAANMVRIMISSRAGALLDRVQVGNAFKSLPEGGYIAFELRGQNFGVLVHRCQDIIRFEQFELLARNKDVMNCKVELDHTTHPTCRPMVAKGGNEQIEERDTINPRLIGLLTGFLRGLGRQACSTLIMKHSREEVLWMGARVSWHRSASWMFLRICLQLVLDRGREAVQASLYKEFMAFLMSKLLQQALSMDIPDHLVYCMVAKVNRRFLKLSSILTCRPDWFAVSSKAVEEASSKLEKKWTTIQDAEKRVVNLKALKNLRFHEDTALTLAKLKPYLDWISGSSRNSERIDGANPESGFSFTRAKPYSLPKFDPLKVRALAEHIQCYSLADFENWVAENLQEWLLAHIDQSNTCEDLSRLIDDYYTVAKLRYENNPVNLSIMWITIMELWVACDKSVTELYPLLKDHRVGFPEGLLEPLLLPAKSQMTRLREVENYLATRHDAAKRDFPSAFEGFGHENSFAARFYEISKQHQELHQQILTSAKKARAAKLEELKSKKEAYDNLKRYHDSLEHQVVGWMTRYGRWREECAWDCSKCRVAQEMKNMRISVHEWPLPQKKVHAKIVVFELQVPSAIVAWRRATMGLMVDFLKNSEDSEDTEDPLIPTQRAPYWALDFPDLKPYAWPPHTRRLQLASVTKPFTRAHYRDIAVAEASEHSTCKNHGCKYDYYDFEYTYTPGAPWSPMGQDRDHILKSQSATTTESSGLPVSINLLDGSLLVNGRPLSRLPKEFQDHPTYARLFGTQILEVVPSELPLMDFSAARKQKGWVVHFGMIGDGLTGRTGTEEALRILKSAAVISFERLEKEDIRLLTDVASLSPRRRFYPPHLRDMQTVEWSNSLDPLAQSEEFSRVVRSILKRGGNCEMFFPDDAKKIPELNVTDVHLQDRALVRYSTFRVSGFGAEDHTTSFDTLYDGRDTFSDSILQLEQRVCQLTKILLAEQQVMLEHVSDALLDTLYDVMGHRVLGPTSQSTTKACKFNSKWLDEPAVSIGEDWCQIVKYLSRVNLTESKYDLMTFFGALVFSKNADVQVVQALLAFATVPILRALQQPNHPEFDLNAGHCYLESALEARMDKHQRDITNTPEWSLQQYTDEPYHQFTGRRQSAWESKVSRIQRNVFSQLERQWPTSCPSNPDVDNFDRYFDVASVMVEVRRHFASWERNLRLRRHLQSAISIMTGLKIASARVPQYAAPGDEQDLLITRSDLAFVPIARLTANEPPTIICERPPSFDDCYSYVAKDIPVGAGNDDKKRLLHLLLSLRARASRVHEREYVDDLEKSFRSSQVKPDADKTAQFVYDDGKLRIMIKNHVETCRHQVSRFQQQIQKYLRGTNHEFDVAFSCYCFPRLTPILFLQQLNRHNWSKLSVGWQRCFVAHCLALTHLHRSERLLAAVGNANQLAQEMENVGHTWDPMVLPESLLLEVESGIMIREVQEKIAAPMRNPDQNNNSVMQLNMGEGKSSVIVQIVAASLADGDRLVRIIVAKPQSKQMRHMLVTKLGGLLDRQVFFMPFSRSIAMDAAKIQHMRRTLTECMENGGVLLVQPEHILSFKLMGIEYVGCSPTKASAYSTDSNPDPTSASGVASTKAESYSMGIELLETQKFLDQHCRDIIDESDENFSVKFELIYTIGLQVPVEMSPERWVTIQNILSVVCQWATEVQKSAPNGIQLQSVEAGQFATLRILKESAGNILLQLVARTVCEKGVHGLPIAHQNPVIRQAVLNYILDERLTNDNAFLVQDDEKGFFCQETKGVLLLLRGLFAGGILKFALSQKRWRVNYGLAERKPPKLVAVPYRAKDNPAPRAEFSHPDIVIVLTCLSYYYGGLCDAQLFTSFEHLQRSDHANEEFADWVKGSPKLSTYFHQLTGINLKDREQCIRDIFPALRLTKAVIDFYLNKVVFPKEMVEFPKKLSASGWDLAKTKAHPVTGFSGTCDSKYILPLEIQHLDLPDQLHTNAMVLNRLLRSENLVRELGPNISSTSLLQSVVDAEPPIQVILDVGALIVELDNEQVAREWLRLSPAHDKQAAIFVNDKDELLVLNRGGFIEPFLTSPFVGDTKVCLVFLDEAHTRGIDLKLPDDYRAAVTLGPALTKDRLVQACMRMRKLGKGQSVTFFIPQEIQERIRNCASLGTNAPLAVTNVLLWSISETWTDTEKSIPLWAMQGVRHQRQEVIWNNKIAQESTLTLESNDLRGYFEDEAMSLEQRYLPNHRTPGHVFNSLAADNELTERKEQVDRIRATCERYQIASFSSATLSEEQERELAPEMEQERQAERPNLMEPKQHIIHPDVLELVRRGNLNLNGGGFLAAFESFNRSTARRLANLVEFGQDLLVTTDFAKAVDLTAESHSDAFHRPVQWVLTRKNWMVDNQFLVILSPWEANELLLEIDKSSYVYLHSYAARRNLSFPTLQDLKLCTTPSIPPDWTSPPKSLILQLNLFAGQLYFEDMTEYKETCAFLGLSCVPNDGSVTVRPDGFVGQGTIYPRCRFTQSPTAFLRVVMSNIRRECQDISRTHVGRMLAGEILTESDFHTNAE
ncbi:hypothetical protein DL768_004701 [Monosporascus sp. mg162]|nr:hypothetical protein DL768_004701 [Monosporascus sp. mg162]